MKIAREYKQSDAEAAASARGRRSRRKGHDFERDIVNRFAAVLPEGMTAERGLQFRGGGCNPDVSVRNAQTQEPILHIECKKGKAPNPRTAYNQALVDCIKSWEDSTVGAIPVAITQADRDHVLVTMNWMQWIDFFLAYLKENSEG